MPKRPPVSVFAVEEHRLQLTWPWLDAEGLTVEVGPSVVELPTAPPAQLRRIARRPRQIGPGPFGPGAVDLDGLDPATTYDVTITGPGRPRQAVGRVTTLAPPPGAPMARFATVSDLHVGERGFGAFHTIVDVMPVPQGTASYAERCATAAFAEAEGWGAERVLAKGDLTRDSEPVEFHEVARVIDRVGVPVDVIFGNHDVRHQIDGEAILAGHGITVATSSTCVDIPGLRIILAHTPLSTERRGRLGHTEIDRLADLAGEVRPGPVALVMHHAPQPRRIPVAYPPGLYGPESAVLTERLRAANPDTFILVGHTHRNRRYRAGGLTVAEVGSTKDYPGQWAGYVIHEGGIRQVVRRIAAPEVMAWTESTRYALHGLWGLWSPGSLSDRCWVQKFS